MQKIIIFIEFDAPELPQDVDIDFIQIDSWTNTMPTNYKRFVVYEDFLIHNFGCNVVLMTNLFDVHSGQKPFDFFSQHREYDIYAGISFFLKTKAWSFWISTQPQR